VDSAITATLQPPGVLPNTLGDENASRSGKKILTRLKAFELLGKGKAKYLTPAERMRTVADYFGPDYQLSQDNEKFKGVLAVFISKCLSDLRNCRGNESHYMKKQGRWLSGSLISGQLKSAEINCFSPKTKKFKSLSRTTQYRQEKELKNTLSANATSNKIKSLKINESPLPKSSAKSLEAIINLCLASETAATDIINLIKQNSAEPYTPEEAVSVFGRKRSRV
jgi:hypothetical protein